ncbi:MAG: hypothetical protein ACXVZP_02010 [Gaiellaceae bacterium]
MSERDSRAKSDSERQAVRRVAARDEGMLRLGRLTRVSVVGATALVGLFAFVAARAVPGRKLHSSGTRIPAVASKRSAAPPSASSATPVLPAEGADSSTPSLAPPTSAPQPSTQQPVAVSGGS